MEEYKFKKSTCERYDMNWGDGGWATITIDENGGVFNCQSDYGNYSYSWPNHGRETFKHFLIEISTSPDYLLGKVAERDWFNFDESLEKWKKEIINIRKSNECTRDEARDAWEFLYTLDDYSRSSDVVEKEIYESSEISAICPDEPYYVFDVDKDYSPQALAFANEIMTMFADILKKEIESTSKIA